MDAKDYSYACPAFNEVEELYLATNYWLSSVDFSCEEFHFFKKILKSFRDGSLGGLNAQVVNMQQCLYQLELKRHLLKAEIINYRVLLDLQLKEMILNGDSPSLAGLLAQHQKLHQDFLALSGEVNRFKDELFSISEAVFGD